jgi:Ca-activated chloride channel family protein
MQSTQINLQVLADLDLINRQSPTERIIEITIIAPTSGEEKRPRPRLNLALVIDRSGSMSGEKLVYVKQAARHVIEQLNLQDQAALVAYDDEVQMLAPILPINEANRRQLVALIADLQVGGFTNLSGGWLTGCQQIAEHLLAGGLNRSLLLTDGLANRGITDLEELAHHAGQLNQRSVSTSTFGVGYDFNEHLLESLANQGGGNFYFIEHPREIQGIFARELEGLMAVTAAGVVLTIILPAQVSASVLGGWKHQQEGQALLITLGDLTPDQPRAIYLKCQLPPQSANKSLTFKLQTSASGKDGAALHAGREIAFRYAADDEVASKPRLPEVMKRYSDVAVADAATEALKLEREGQLTQASQLVAKTLAESAPFIQEDTRRQYQSLSDRMRIGLTEQDRKQSHQAAYIKKQTRRVDKP